MELLQKYIQENTLVKHQIDSFNDFVINGIQRHVNAEDAIEATHGNRTYIYRFSNPYMDSPCYIDEKRFPKPLTPMDARMRDLTYEGSLYVDITTLTLDTTTRCVMQPPQVVRRFMLAKIPVMIGSCLCTLKKRDDGAECKYEEGGYFIIRGKERVLVSQERMNYNCVNIYKEDNGWMGEIRSMSEETCHSVYVSVFIPTSKRNVTMNIPYIQAQIPVGIIMLALGMHEIDIKARLLNGLHEYREASLIVEGIVRDMYCIVPKKLEKEQYDLQTLAKIYISEFKMHTSIDPKAYIEQVLESEIFPHLGITANVDDILYFMIYMVQETIKCCIGVRKVSERDHMNNKRVESPGILLSELFRKAFKRFVRSLISPLQKQNNIISVITSPGMNKITKNIRYCFSTGNWELQKTSYVRTGVSQVLTRISYLSALSHLRRVVIPISKEVKNIDMRQLHTSSIFFTCPHETPEGACVGIVKNLSLTATISLYISQADVIMCVKDLIQKHRLDTSSLSNAYPLLVNGRVVTWVADIQKACNQLRCARANGILNKYVSVSSSDQCVYIYCDEGRLMRPLIRKEYVDEVFHPDHKHVKFNAWVEKGAIEYLDSHEIDEMEIAMTHEECRSGSYQYCEIHPCAMLGAVVATIPWPSNNQGPRVCYFSSMAKQTIGYFASNQGIRMDTSSYTLGCVQKPLIDTQLSETIGTRHLPGGMNCVVAIAAFDGHNQEDCIIMNKSAVERGLFVSTSMRTVTVEEKKPPVQLQMPSTIIGIPPAESRKKFLNYDKLDKNGIVMRGAVLQQGDVLVGRYTQHTLDAERKKVVCTSIVVGVKEEGVVDDIWATRNEDGYRMFKIRIRVLKIPELGDKFADRSAQKGTIGMMFRQEDMPFTSEGIIPDIILSCHAIPSRMTISRLLEVITGKVCAIKSEFGDCTPWNMDQSKGVEKMCDALEGEGYERMGYEDMFNGMTGEKIQSQIFIGPTYYQKLKHMVSDKVYARGYGNVQMFSRQPGCGRSKGGSLRMGEMETQALFAEGLTANLIDRLYNASDPYTMLICDQCGMTVNDRVQCSVCKTGEISKVRLPYACKLLQHQLNAMLINTKIMPVK